MFSNLTDWDFTDFYDISKIMESPIYRDKHRPEQFRKYLDIINRKKKNFNREMRCNCWVDSDSIEAGC